MGQRRFELRTLGGLSLNEQGEIRGASFRKPLAVLAIAAVAGPRGVARHQLIALLWPDLVRSRANHVLSQTLYALRRDLGSDAITVGETVVLNAEIVEWDVARFRTELRSADLEAAASTYQGSFLEGVSFDDCEEFENWIAPIRASLAEEHATLRARLSEQGAIRLQVGSFPSRQAGSRLFGRAAGVVLTTLGALLVSVVTWQLVSAGRQPHDAGLFDELTAERLRTFRERERTPRGRIFIETPINRSRDPVLDSLGASWVGRLASIIRDSRIAHVVPRDTVMMIEREVAKLGWATPVQRLERANASINVMTVITGSADTPRVFVRLQRIHEGPSRIQQEWMQELRRREGLRQVHDSQLNKPFRGTESVPFATVEGPRDSVSRRMFRLTASLSRAFDEMRYCDLERHSSPESLPWCWASENKAVVVKGFQKQKQERLRANRASTP